MRFDWIRLKTSLYTERRVKRGSKDVMMHFAKLKNYMISEGREGETDAEWQRLLEETPAEEKDFKGPVGSEERVPVSAEDFTLREKVSGSRGERVSGTRAKKNPNAKDYEQYDLATHEGHLRWGDEHFNIGNRTASTSNKFVTAGHEVPQSAAAAEARQRAWVCVCVCGGPGCTARSRSAFDCCAIYRYPCNGHVA